MDKIGGGESALINLSVEQVNYLHFSYSFLPTSNLSYVLYIMYQSHTDEQQALIFRLRKKDNV